MKMKLLSPVRLPQPPRLFSPPTIALSVEGGSVRFIVCSRGRITAWGIEPLERGAVRDGIVAEPGAVGATIKALLTSHKIGDGRLAVSLTGQRSVPRVLEFPGVSPRLLKEAIPREMKREMPVPLDETFLSWQVIDTENGHQRVFALGVPRDVLGPLLEALKFSGRRAHAVDIRPLALVRAVGRRDAMIADLEPETVDIIVARGGLPATMRTVSLPPEGQPTEDKIVRMIEELKRTVKFYNDTHPDDPLPPETPLTFTGSLADSVAGAGAAEASVEFPVLRAAPALQCPPDMPLPALMVNIGLALKEL